VQEAADLLQVSPSTLRRWSDGGRIAFRRTPGGQRQFPLEELQHMAAGPPPLTPGPPPGGSVSDHRYRLLYETSRDLTSSLELEEVLQAAARRLTSLLHIPDCDIYRLVGGDQLVCLASTIGDSRDASWVGQRLALADWPSERLAVEHRRPVAVRSLDDPLLSDTEREDMASYGQRSCLTLPLVARDQVVGVVDLLEHVEREFADEEIATAAAVGQVVGQALAHAQLYEQVKRLHLGNLRALSTALSAKDFYTLGHASRVAAYAALLAKELGWPQASLEAMENAAFLHDIGKIGVSDRILLKAGPLTSEEWELVHRHPDVSAEIVRPLFDADLVAGVRHHHEHFDGSGYPHGIAGEDIPAFARALCVVDSYDAMSSRRPYRGAMSYEQCLSELARCAGTHFDPVMAEAFARVLRRLQEKRAQASALAAKAAELIDPEAHSRLRSRADEARPEYVEMVGALRAFRDAHQPVRFITTYARDHGECVTVLDTGEGDEELSHCGDPWSTDDEELNRVLCGESVSVNVLDADAFGVWVSGIAPVSGPAGEVVAAVSVDTPAVETLASALDSDHSQTLQAMLQSAAMRYNRAEVEAITDGLTGLYNHRYLHERLEEELRRSKRRGTPLAVLFCDCDHFKEYNDAYGHKAGDDALAQIARILEAGSRRTDMAARYGGEEFVVVLLDTGADGAFLVAEGIRSEVERVCGRQGRGLTVSIGVAACPEDANSRDELLDKADWAMYGAKRSGRNRVLAFSDSLVREETWLSRRGR
jgi:diguanylate cyclase (GGDEF)-like protein/excisionase family DNA binding protein